MKIYVYSFVPQVTAPTQAVQYYPPCYSIWKWSFWEMLNVSGVFMNGIDALYDMRKVTSACQESMQQGRHAPVGKEALSGHWIGQHIRLGLLIFRIVKSMFVV